MANKFDHIHGRGHTGKEQLETIFSITNPLFDKSHPKPVQCTGLIQCYFKRNGMCFIRNFQSCPHMHNPEFHPEIKQKIHVNHIPKISIPNCYSWEGREL